MLQQQLPALKNSAQDGPSFSSFIDQYFGGSFDVEMKCAEAPDEPSTTSKENFLQLSCFISQEVKYMLSGLKSVSFVNRNCSDHEGLVVSFFYQKFLFLF